MKRLLPVWLALCVGLSTVRADTVPIYNNDGVINDFPADQIDAFAFANYGVFNVQTTIPFDFQNTVNITNYGSMGGLPGFFFDTAFMDKPRQPAGTFLNDFGASITVYPMSIGIFTINNPSYLLVSASNVVNHGLLSVSDSGWLRLRGDEVDATRSGLEVRPPSGAGGQGFATDTNFYPDLGISDIWWGGETNQVLDVTQ